MPISRHVLIALTLALATACGDSPEDVASTTEALTLTLPAGCTASMGPGEMVTGLYDASKGNQSAFNQRKVTVRDYRKCSGGDFLDGKYVAEAVGAPVPSYRPTVQTDGGYRVYAPTTKSNGKLLFYLPGSQGAVNDGKEQLLQRAAYLGYHVIAVMYWNDEASEVGHCGNGKPDHMGCPTFDAPTCNPYTQQTTPITLDDCVVRTYRNQFRNFSDPDKNFTNAHIGLPGIPAFLGDPAVSGSKCVPGDASNNDVCVGSTEGQLLRSADSALLRARKLLQYLAIRHGAEWAQFAPAHDGNYDVAPFLDWSKVALVGHSTGSKVIFHEAHENAIGRVVLLSGPNLGSTRSGPTPASLESYFDDTMATSRSNIYAFSNTYDPSLDRALASWANMKFSLAPSPGTQTGLAGLQRDNAGVVTGGSESKQPCTGPYCWITNPYPECNEFPPKVTDPSAHAIQYSGMFDVCTGSRSAIEYLLDPDAIGKAAHASTTSSSSCSGSTPDTCWYLNVWDYLLTW